MAIEKAGVSRGMSVPLPSHADGGDRDRPPLSTAMPGLGGLAQAGIRPRRRDEVDLSMPREARHHGSVALGPRAAVLPSSIGGVDGVSSHGEALPSLSVRARGTAGAASSAELQDTVRSMFSQWRALRETWSDAPLEPDAHDPQPPGESQSLERATAMLTVLADSLTSMSDLLDDRIRSQANGTYREGARDG